MNEWKKQMNNAEMNQAIIASQVHNFPLKVIQISNSMDALLQCTFPKLLLLLLYDQTPSFQNFPPSFG